MKRNKMIGCVALVILGVFVSYTKPDVGGIAFGHLLSVTAAYLFGRLQKSE